MKLAKKLLSNAAAEFAESYPEGFRQDSSSPTVSAVARFVGNTLHQRATGAGGRQGGSLVESIGAGLSAVAGGRPRARSTDVALTPDATGEAAGKLLAVAHDSLRFQGEQLRLLESLLALTTQLAAALQSSDVEIEDRAMTHLVQRLCLLEARHDATSLSLQNFISQPHADHSASTRRIVDHPVKTVAEELLDFSMLQRESLRSLEYTALGASTDASGAPDVRSRAAAVDKLASALFETLSSRHELLSALISELALPRLNADRVHDEPRGMPVSAPRRSSYHGDDSVDREYQRAVRRHQQLSSSQERTGSAGADGGAKEFLMNKASDAVQSFLGTRAADPRTTHSPSMPQMMIDGHREEILSPSPAPGPPTSLGTIDFLGAPSSSSSSAQAALVNNLQQAVQDILDDALTTMSSCDQAVNDLLVENKSLRERLTELEKKQSNHEAHEHAASLADEKMRELQLERDTAVAARAAAEGDSSLMRRKNNELSEVVDAANATCRRLEHKSSLHDQRARTLEKQVQERDEAIVKLQQGHDSVVAELTHEIEVARGKQLHAEETCRRAKLDVEEQMSELKVLRQRLLEKQSEITNVKKMFTALESSHAALQGRTAGIVGGGDSQRVTPVVSHPQRHQQAAASDHQPAVESPRAFKLPAPQRTIQMSAEKPAGRDQFQAAHSSSSNVATAIGGSASELSALVGLRRGNDAHVHRVLADARNLLHQLESSHNDRGAARAGDDVSCSSSEGTSALTCSSSGSMPAGGGSNFIKPVGGPRHEQNAEQRPAARQEDASGGLQDVVKDLRNQCAVLEEEARILSAQEMKVLDRRSLLNTTLLAQRNQLLMRNAPDAEVDALNQKISSLLQQISNTSSQIEANKKSVASKLDLVRLQLNVALQRGHQHR